jgi:histidyl-tRNA synthetase
MAKQKKTPKIQRPKAQTPKGFRDYFGAEVAQRTDMLRTIAGVYHRYGFEALESAAVETVEALGKFLPDVDRPNEGVFAWQEDDEKGPEAKGGDWLALRYDLTAPLARVFAQHRNDLPTPYRRFAMGPVWRNEKPGPGRFRQFYQCDADTVGSGSVAADAEICAMLCDTLEAVGIERGDYVVRINNRKVLNGVLEAVESAHVPSPDGPPEHWDDMGEWQASILRTIDKFDKVGENGVRELLGKGRLDASGAFIDGVGLSDNQTDRVINFMLARERALADLEARKLKVAGGFMWRVLTAGKEFATPEDIAKNLEEAMETAQGRARLSNFAVVSKLSELVGDSEIGNRGVAEIAEMADLLAAGGYHSDRIVIDPSVVRGLGYYTGPVFEAELTFEIKDDKGRPRSFGSVAGGGRYDDLVKRFTGQEVPATGVSIGVDRLLAALHMKGRLTADTSGPVVVTVMDRDRMADYQAIVSELRQAGIRSEVYLGNPKNFGNQLKYADQRNSPIAIIQGGDELAAGTLQIKDLILGAKIAETATHEEWKDRPSQFEIPRADLVERIKALLVEQAK